MAIPIFILTLLSAVICFILVDINSKIPPRDYGEEALWRDRKRNEATSGGVGEVQCTDYIEHIPDPEQPIDKGEEVQ